MLKSFSSILIIITVIKTSHILHIPMHIGTDRSMQHCNACFLLEFRLFLMIVIEFDWLCLMIDWLYFWLCVVCGVWCFYYCDDNENWTKWFEHIVSILNVLCLFWLWIKKNSKGGHYIIFYGAILFLYILTNKKNLMEIMIAHQIRCIRHYSADLFKF